MTGPASEILTNKGNEGMGPFGSMWLLDQLCVNGTINNCHRKKKKAANSDSSNAVSCLFTRDDKARQILAAKKARNKGRHSSY